MKRKLGILVGHYGPGTGASYNGRDEWMLAYVDAGLLMREICHALPSIDPIVIAIDHRKPLWVAINGEIGERGGLKDRNQEIRAKWALAEACEAIIELHYNSDETHKARGHEVYYDDGEFGDSDAVKLATAINAGLTAEFPEHPNRGAKPGRYQVLDMARKWAMPAAIVEPAFISEDVVAAVDWRDRYVRALIEGLKTYFV